jgi:hypothetical protein
MNTPLFIIMKSSILHSGSRIVKRKKIAIKPQIIGLAIVVFASLFVAGCNDNNSTTVPKKTDSVAPPNAQRGEGESEGERGNDSNHRGMGHAGRGMDSMHGGRHQ